MPKASARDVQRLRQASGAGMLDARRALEENDGDFDASMRWLREKGLASSARRADRENDQGAVAVSATDEAGAIVELKCETDFVAKSPDFVNLVSELAQLVAAKGEQAARDSQGDIDDLRISLKENVALGKVVRFERAPGAVLGTYLHVQAERGVNAVLVELSGGDDSLAHHIAVHVAFARPSFISRDQVPSDMVESERATLETISRNEGKPENALAKIVEGRLGGWFKERCLLEQPYVRDEKRTIRQLLGDATVTRFAQVTVGT